MSHEPYGLLSANALRYPDGGGHVWVYLNWALGLRALGARVIWLEKVASRIPARELDAKVAALKRHLAPYGLAESLALCSPAGEPPDKTQECLDLDAATQADLLLNLRYSLHPKIVKRFRRSALVDVDPGLLQIWMSEGQTEVALHDVYFTTSEVVGTPQACFPDAGIQWRHAPPCVALEFWPQRQAAIVDAPFTTISHWNTHEDWVKSGRECYLNDKRTGFAPFLDLPRRTNQPLELALGLAADQEHKRAALREQGWRVRDAQTVAATPWDYQSYIQNSLGEFSCAKPSCMRLQNAWISDRTLCYLASGKPAVVQHTGPSRLLPEHAGVFRFRDIKEAAWALEAVASDYERQCKLARSLAEEHFDATRVAKGMLERALA